MQLIHIFQALTGDAATVGIPITAFFVVLFCIFFFGAKKRAQAVGGVWYQQQMAKYYLIPIVLFWLGALAWIWSDYRPYDPKKDGVPKVQTDTTRQAAEDMIEQQKK